MKALVLTDYKKMEYTDVEKPRPGRYEVLIRVKSCGICGSDVMGYDGSTGRRRPPVIMGHEASGVIEELGTDVTDWKIGDRVTFDSTIYCDECDECRHGNVNLCTNRKVVGVSCADYRQNGAFAEYIVLPQHILYKLPENVTFDQAAMIEPLSIAFHAANLVQHPIGASAAVVGSGKIGMLLIQTLRIYGYGKITAIKKTPADIEFYKSIGADDCIFTDSCDARAESQKLTSGKGYDVVFEAAGNEDTIGLSLDICKRNGEVVLIGNTSPRVQIPLQTVVTKQLHLIGSCASSGEYPACLDMISHKLIDIDKMIGHRAPLADGAYWFERLYTNRKENLKVILNP